jgi:hypothetical protein
VSSKEYGKRFTDPLLRSFFGEGVHGELLDGHALRQLSGLVNVATSAYGYGVRLCGRRGVGGGLLRGWAGVVRGLGDLDGVFYEVLNLFVAFDDDGDDSARCGR